MKSPYRLLLYLHAFVGIGALFGGLAGMLNPQEPLGIPAELLEGSPFSSYFIPALILFVVIGLGHSLSAITAWRRSEYQGYISSVFSWALMIWIVVQCIIIRAVDFLHVLYFSIGLFGAIIAMRLLFEQNAFPASLLRK
jgi:hypothetical protein